jgi:hypothetical protein
MQIGVIGNEYLFVISIICDYGVKKKFSKNTNPKKHLCIIFHMVLNILIGLVKENDPHAH